MKPGLENFEHYFTSLWDECNCAVVWAFFGIAFLWDWDENWPFPVLWPLLSFQICWHIVCSTFTVSSFRIWNSSTAIPSPPLALFVVILSKAICFSPFAFNSSFSFEFHICELLDQNNLNRSYKVTCSPQERCIENVIATASFWEAPFKPMFLCMYVHFSLIYFIVVLLLPKIKIHNSYWMTGVTPASWTLPGTKEEFNLHASNEQTKVSYPNCGQGNLTQDRYLPKAITSGLA